MPRLVAVNRFYAPDHAPTSELLADLAEHLAAAAWQVTVVTSRMRYDDPAAVLPARELRRGVQVRRVWTSRFGRHWLPGRAVDYLTFYLAAGVALLAELRAGDIVLVKTDPPLIGLVAALAARIRGARLVNWCQDLFPEIAAALGMRWAAGPVGRVLRHLRNRTLRAAEVNVALEVGMAAHLAREGVPGERIAILPNWADPDVVRPVPAEDNPLRREWSLDGHRVIGYSGNLGRAHAVAAVRDFLARMSAHDPDLRFLFVGGGAGLETLRAWAAANGLDRILFQPYQPRERLALSLSAPDIHLVSLDPACEDLIVPSKLYGILAAGRPIVALVDPEGDMARLVERLDVGLVWREGRERQVMALLDQDRSAGLRGLFLERFARPIALRRWQALLEGVTVPARTARAVRA